MAGVTLPELPRRAESCWSSAPSDASRLDVRSGIRASVCTTQRRMLRISDRLEPVRKIPLALWIVLVAALALRLGWAITRPVDDATIDQLPDQREYLEIARSVLHGEGFSFAD